MSKSEDEVCRLCLKTLKNLQVFTDFEKQCINIVFPDMDLGITTDPKICLDCSQLLVQSFNFKSQCLEIEDNILAFKLDENGQVDLEQIVGIKTEARICRTCLQSIKRSVCTKLELGNGITEFLKRFIPEVEIERALRPVICEKCEHTVKKLEGFVTLCLDNEEKNKTDLTNSAGTDVLLNVIKDEVVNESKVIVISDQEDSLESTTVENKSDSDNTLGPPLNKKRKTDDEASTNAQVYSEFYNMTIYCKYCFYATDDETEAITHIHTCPRNVEKQSTAPSSPKPSDDHPKSTNQSDKTQNLKKPCDKSEIFDEQRVFITACKGVLRVKKVHSIKWWDKHERNKTKENEIQEAVEKNKRVPFTIMRVLVCDLCGFNSKSQLKMALHCETHSNQGSHAYVTLYVCVGCCRLFRCQKGVNVHDRSCTCTPKVDKSLLLLKMGEVYHCSRCKFDSDDNKSVLEHLLECGKAVSDTVSKSS